MSKPFSWEQASLPCPAPLDVAVEAGVFGVCADGTLRPAAGEVAAMTEEQARVLLSTLCDSKHLERQRQKLSTVACKLCSRGLSLN